MVLNFLSATTPKLKEKNPSEKRQKHEKCTWLVRFREKETTEKLCLSSQNNPTQ